MSGVPRYLELPRQRVDLTGCTVGHELRRALIAAFHTGQHQERFADHGGTLLRQDCLDQG
ncbi:MAG: hypothetical protein C4289_15925 [Chloroflexota bacterium]